METSEKSVKRMYILGAVTTILVLAGVLLDMVTGIITGGDITMLPATATGRFEQLRENAWLGLYNLDLLNTLNQLILIPTILALYVAHQQRYKAPALLAFTLFLVGTTLFVAGNTSLTMLDLSRKYFGTADQELKTRLAAAGEAMLARGAHGSLSAFIGFALPTFANLLMSWLMLRGKVFSKINSYAGLLGNLLMLTYIVLVTFVHGIGEAATAFAMPGGILLIVWMVMLLLRLFKLANTKE